MYDHEEYGRGVLTNSSSKSVRKSVSKSEIQSNVITIDGPAASGKTSVSRELAKRLGWSWVSTGAFYRGLAFVAQREGVKIDNEEALAQLVEIASWKVVMTAEKTVVQYHGRDVTELVGSEEVGNIASKISHFPKVRQALLRAQRECQNGVPGLVAEGRDCGTVVFPEAKLKFFLTANLNHRAERRAKEHGLSALDLIEIQSQRDQQDATRKTAPMKIPDAAVVIDSTDLSLAEVVAVIEQNLTNSKR